MTTRHHPTYYGPPCCATARRSGAVAYTTQKPKPEIMVYAKARRAVVGGVVSFISLSRGGHRRTRASYESWKGNRDWKPSKPGIAESHDEDAGNYYYRRPQVTDHVFSEALATPNPTHARCCCAVLSCQVVAARAGELRDLMILMRRRESAPDAGASPQGSIGTTTTIIIMDRGL